MRKSRTSGSVRGTPSNWCVYSTNVVNSFAGCRNLEVINIPQQIVLIDDGAFYGCCSLKAINIPNRVVGIGSMAFAGTDLSTIVIPKRVSDT